MELKLVGYDAVRIKTAKLVDGGDILVEVEDGFIEISKTYGFDIIEAYLAEVDFKWSLVIFLYEQGELGENNAAVLQVENQEDVYRLKALL